MRIRTAILLIGVLALPALAGPMHNVPARDLVGTPTVEEGKQVGYFLWFDRDGLHIRWTTDGTPYLFSGRLDLDRPVKKLNRVRDDAGGWAQTHGSRIVMFSATSRGPIDGIDVEIPGGRKVWTDLRIDGKDPLPEQVTFGAKGNHPKGFPLSITLR